MKKILLGLTLGLTIFLTGCGNGQSLSREQQQEFDRVHSELENAEDDSQLWTRATLNGVDFVSFDLNDNPISFNESVGTPILQWELNKNPQTSEMTLYAFHDTTATKANPQRDRIEAEVQKLSNWDELIEWLTSTNVNYTPWFSIDGEVSSGGQRHQLSDVPLGSVLKEVVINSWDDDAQLGDVANLLIRISTENTKSADAETEVSRDYRNAKQAARDFLSFMNFSRDSLIGQLEFGGHPTSAAVWALDELENNNEVDWYEQAIGSAKGFLDLMPMSKDALISQLEFGGFTPSQAQHGVDQAW